MSWVSYTKLKELCDGLRNKMVSNEYLLANSDKSKGVHMNVGGQDGLMIMSPTTEDGSTPAALWVTDSEANNATELTGGTLSYVTNNGQDSEDYTTLSLVGGVVNVSGKSGAQRRITNVATPTGDNDAATKKYVDDNAVGVSNIGKLNISNLLLTNIPTSTQWIEVNQGDLYFVTSEYPTAIGSIIFEVRLSANGTAHYIVSIGSSDIIREVIIYNPYSEEKTFNVAVPFCWTYLDNSKCVIKGRVDEGTTISTQFIYIRYIKFKKGIIEI